MIFRIPSKKDGKKKEQENHNTIRKIDFINKADFRK